MTDTTKERLKSWGVDIFFALFFLAAGAFLYHQYIVYKGTQVKEKAIDIVIPGYVTDKGASVTVTEKKPKKPKEESKPLPSKDTVTITESTATEEKDSSQTYEYSAVVKDSLTTNWLTVKVRSMSPVELSIFVDSTRYDTLKIHYVYLDTTINVTKGNDLTTYGLVAVGAAAGSAINDELGAAIGGVTALLIDWIFF